MIIPDVRGGEHLSSFVESDASGNFLFYEAEESFLTERRLYVTGPSPHGAVQLIPAPFNMFPQLREKRFKGQRILVKKNIPLDLGDVPVQVRYGIVKVNLRDRNGALLITNIESWRGVWLRVRDTRGRTITTTSLSINNVQEAVNAAESSITVALPEGTWRI